MQVLRHPAGAPAKHRARPRLPLRPGRRTPIVREIRPGACSSYGVSGQWRPAVTGFSLFSLPAGLHIHAKPGDYEKDNKWSWFADLPGCRGDAEETVALLHGGPGMPDYPANVARLLLPVYRVVHYGQRGSGNSICLDGRFRLADHLADLESVRQACQWERMHLLGHSWGGLLAQLHAAGHPDRVKRLFLCNLLPGAGEYGRAMKRASAVYPLQRGGLLRVLALGALVAGTAAPGRVGRWAARRVTSLAWRDFFDPFPSPPLGNTFLRVISVKTFSRMRRAALRADASQLDGVVLPEPTRWPSCLESGTSSSPLQARSAPAVLVRNKVACRGQDIGPGSKIRRDFAASCVDSLPAELNPCRTRTVRGNWPTAERQFPRNGGRNL